MEKHMAVCPYCGAGCKLNLIVDDGMVIGAEGLDGVTNEGELCLKGLSGFDFINDTKILTPRILHPMIRREKGGELERVTWDEALDFTAKKLMAIKEKYGPDAIMLTGSSRGPGNEANYVMQKFTRAWWAPTTSTTAPAPATAPRSSALWTPWAPAPCPSPFPTWRTPTSSCCSATTPRPRTRSSPAVS